MGLVAAEPLSVAPAGADSASWLLTFDESMFAPACFERESIECPPAIGRSISRRQAEFFFGRLAARFAFSELGIEGVRIPVGATREPLWPPGFVGSITHSGGLAAAAIARRGAGINGMGIDIERAARPGDMEALHSTVMDEAERECLQAGADMFPRNVLATLAFSAKESLYKAVFPSIGRFFDFRAAKVVEPPNAEGKLTLLIAEDLSAHFSRGRRCEVAFALIRAEAVLTSFVW